MSWWEYAAKAGLPTRVGPRRIDRGPYSYFAKQKPVRDYLSEPLDYLALPLDVFLRGADATH